MADLNGLTVEQFLADSVQIEPLAIQEEYIRIPSDLAYWNTRYAAAQEDFQRAKLAADITEATRYVFHRERLANSGSKVTEAQVDAVVRQDEQVIATKEALISAESEKNRLNGVVDAVRTKRDMLVSLGAHMRAELQGDPSLRSEAADVRASKLNPRRG